MQKNAMMNRSGELQQGEHTQWKQCHDSETDCMKRKMAKNGKKFQVLLNSQRMVAFLSFSQILLDEKP